MIRLVHKSLHTKAVTTSKRLSTKMSVKTDIKEASFYMDWLEKSITDEYFNHYEYSELKDLQYIGEGSFGKIMRANWKSNHFFALKSFKNDKVTLKEIVNEVLVLQLL